MEWEGEGREKRGGRERRGAKIPWFCVHCDTYICIDYASVK